MNTPVSKPASQQPSEPTKPDTVQAPASDADQHMNMPVSKPASQPPSEAIKPDTVQAPASDADQQLLSALREFIRWQGLPKTETVTRVSIRDALWLLISFFCVFLALYQIDASWLNDEVPKLIMDKVLPWFLSLSTIAAVLKSPDSVLKITRHGKFRWIVVPLSLLLLAAVLPFFKIKPRVDPGVIVYADGVRRDGQFRVSFKAHDIELKSADDRTPPRHLRVTRRDLLHGLFFRPDWRLVYSIQLQAFDDAVDICFEPQHFEIDRAFGDEVIGTFRRTGPTALEYFLPLAGSFTVPLPAGQYRVAGFRADCGTTSPLFVEVGPDAPIGPYRLKQVNCSGKPEASSSPCEQVLSNAHF